MQKSKHDFIDIDIWKFVYASEETVVAENKQREETIAARPLNPGQNLGQQHA